MKVKDIVCEIKKNEKIADNCYLLEAKLKGSPPNFAPGQFVMVKLKGGEVFLRRPFSVYSQRGDLISIMYKLRGKGTKALSNMKKGEKIYMLGPLGNGFTLKEREIYVVIAGGIGVAGIHLLMEKIGRKAKLFFGANTFSGMLLLRDLVNYDPIVSTMDGSYGYKGDVVSCFRERIEEFAKKDTQIFACGPKEMYRSLKDVLSSYYFDCQVLWEEKMACGMGLCFGCVVETKDTVDPLKRVCFEGPVFDLWELSL